MEWLKQTLTIQSRGKGLYNITGRIQDALSKLDLQEGICHIFLQHTSASLVVSESYDPTARQDLESFMDHLVPENQSWHRHTLEGADDSPSHMRSILTSTSLSIPIDEGELNLGTWQGIYLFEHRKRGHNRRVLLRILKAA